MVYTTTSSAEPPSVMSRLRVSAGQAAELALPIRLSCKQLSKVYVFSAHKISQFVVLLFPNGISHFKILAMPSVGALRF